MKRFLLFVVLAAAAAVACAQTPQYMPRTGGAFAGAVTAPQVNGVFNVSACAYTALAPSWCTAYGNGTDPGDWTNAALMQCKALNANQSCVVSFDPVLTPVLNVATTIQGFTPRTIVEGNGAFLNWTPSAGVMFYLGNSGSRSGGVVLNHLRLERGGAALTDTAYNTSIAITMGGDNGYHWLGCIDGKCKAPLGSSSDVGYDNVLYDLKILGFGTAIQGGQNYFSNSIIGGVLNRNLNVMNDYNCQNNSGERTIAFSHLMVVNNYGNDVISRCGFEYMSDHTSWDYSNQAGFPDAVATATAGGGNTGNGTITELAADVTIQTPGTSILTFLDALRFTVTPPQGALPVLTVSASTGAPNYNSTITGYFGPSDNNSYGNRGEYLYLSGCGQSADNGAFKVSSSANGSIVVRNPNAVLDTSGTCSVAWYGAATPITTTPAKWAVTSIDAPVSGLAVVHGTFPELAANACAGLPISIQNASKGNNNASNMCTASDTTSITLLAPFAQAETFPAGASAYVSKFAGGQALALTPNPGTTPWVAGDTYSLYTWFPSVPTAAALTASTGTGNGTISDGPYPAPGAVSGSYRATLTSPTAFTLADPYNVTVQTCTVGVECSGPVRFTLDAGTIPFQAGDVRVITEVNSGVWYSGSSWTGNKLDLSSVGDHWENAGGPGGNISTFKPLSSPVYTSQIKVDSSFISINANGVVLTATKCEIKQPTQTDSPWVDANGNVFGVPLHEVDITTLSNPLDRLQHVMPAGFSGACAVLNGMPLVTKRFSSGTQVNPTMWRAYVPPDTPIGTEAVSTGTLTSFASIAPITFWDKSPQRGSSGDQEGPILTGKMIIKGTDEQVQFLDATHATNAVGDVAAASKLQGTTTQNYQVPVPLHMTFGKGTDSSNAGLTGDEAMTDSLGVTSAGKNGSVGITCKKGSPWGQTDSSLSCMGLGVDSQLYNGGRHARIIQGMGVDLILSGGTSTKFDAPASRTLLLDRSNEIGVGSTCPWTYVGTTVTTLAQSCPFWVGSDGVVHAPNIFSNPMTTAGDMIVGGASGTPTRVAAGLSTYVWTANGPGVSPSWQPSPSAAVLLSGGCNGTATSSGSNLSLSGLGSPSFACTATANAGQGPVMTQARTLKNLTVRCHTTGVTQASFTGSISGTTLTTSAVTGAVAIGQLVRGSGVLGQTLITAGSGSSWTVNQSQTVGSEAMTGSASGKFTVYNAVNGSGTYNAQALTLTYGDTPADTALQDLIDTVAVAMGDAIQVRFTTQGTDTLGGCNASVLAQ